MCTLLFRPILALLPLVLFLAPVATPAARATVEPKRVIFLIGDGMGLSHVSAASVVNKAPLALERSPVVGLARTSSSNELVTDSAAAGTALATGVRTRNGVIGLDPSLRRRVNMMELGQARGLATGLVVTSPVTHATPAAFVGHQPSRRMEDELAEEIVQSRLDVVMGGGRSHFTRRKDGRDLLQPLRQKGFQVVHDLDEIDPQRPGRLIALLADHWLPPAEERGDLFGRSLHEALSRLSTNPEGFILMVEGSAIDLAGHQNDIEETVDELLDFDRAVAAAFEYADKHPNTLVVVTADHETGGLSIVGGDLKTSTIRTEWSTRGHSATWVPVYAYGAGAAAFAGVYDNTAIFDRICRFLELLPAETVVNTNSTNANGGVSRP